MKLKTSCMDMLANQCSCLFLPRFLFLSDRLFGTKCAKCSQGFSKNDFVMRARNKIFHIDCFRCIACARQLIPGDEFALREDGLLCKADHDSLDRTSSPDIVANNNNNGNHRNYMNGEYTSNNVLMMKSEDA